MAITILGNRKRGDLSKLCTMIIRMMKLLEVLGDSFDTWQSWQYHYVCGQTDEHLGETLHHELSSFFDVVLF